MTRGTRGSGSCESPQRDRPPAGLAPLGPGVRPMVADPVTCAGADTSTTTVAITHLHEDGTLHWINTIRPTGNSALERAVQLIDMLPTPAYWDANGTTRLLIERQFQARGAVSGAHENAGIAWLLFASAWRAGVEVGWVRPQEWRAGLGWPRMRAAEAKRMAVTTAIDATGVATLSTDEAEAYWIAHTAWQERPR